MYRFENINSLFLLSGLVIILLLLHFFNKWRKERLNILAETHLRKHIVNSARISKPVIEYIVFILLVISIANLQIGSRIDKKASPKFIDIILAVDISHSMLAEDIKPSRLELARLFCMRLTEELKFAKTGIVLFAGDAYILMPLTSDPGVAKMFISSISSDLISLQGTAIGKALLLSSDAFTRINSKNKAIILISDGENFEDDPIETAKIIGKENIVIHSVYLGTPGGGPVPLKNNDKIKVFKKDLSGNTVITRPDYALMTDIASLTGGISVDGNLLKNSLKPIIEELEQLERVEGDVIKFSDWHSLFHLFAFPAMILMIIDFMIPKCKKKWQELLYSPFRINLIKKK